MAWIDALILGGSSLLGGSMSANASSTAASEEEQAAAIAAQTQLSMYGQTRSDLLPYMSSGAGALNNLDSLLGITPANVPTTSMPNFSTTGTATGSTTDRSTLDKLSDPANLASGIGGSHSGSLSTALGDVFAGGAGLPGPGISHILGLAHGGRFVSPRSGQRILVGERGPEMVDLAPGSRGYVHPNSPYINRLVGRVPGRAGGGPIGAPNISSADPTLGNMAAYKAANNLGVASGIPGSTATQTPNGITGTAMGSVQTPTTFDPTAGNSTPLPSSGQTPAQIMQQAPEYQFVEQQGIQGLDNSAAASGGLLSGGNIQNILNYSQGLASQQYQNIVNNLSSVASLGESAGAMTGNSGTYAAMGAGNAETAAGNAAAAGTIGASNAYSSSLGNLGFMYAMNPGMFGGSSNNG